MIRKIILLLVLLVIVTGCTATEYVKPEENAVFYEIFVDSFYDSDGDGHGDLLGVKEKLDYIQKDLGATGIWLMPVHPSDSYHKYDVIDYKDIDQRYGTMDDMEQLIEEMNHRDMDLIIDLVINHTSHNNPWFIEGVKEFNDGNCNTYCNYYNFSKENKVNYNKHDSGVYYESGFSHTMPDLNLDDVNVREEIKDITKFWVDKGVSGFRLDATTHFYDNNLEKNTEFLTWFSDYAYSLNDDLIIVGEAWTDASIIKQMYKSNISFFNFSIAQNNGRLTKSINRSAGADFAQYVVNYNDDIRQYNPNAKDSVFLSNHDHGRSASYFMNDEQKLKLAASTYLLMPGDVYVYYGEEIGMIGSGRDENKRLAMQWGVDKGMTKSPKDHDYTGELTMNLKDQQKDSQSIFNHYKSVISVRNMYPQISTAVPTAVDLNDSALYAIQYDDIIIVHNFSSEALTIEGSYEIVNDVLGGKSSDNGILLNGYQSVVLNKK